MKKELIPPWRKKGTALPVEEGSSSCEVPWIFLPVGCSRYNTGDAENSVTSSCRWELLPYTQNGLLRNTFPESPGHYDIEGFENLLHGDESAMVRGEGSVGWRWGCLLVAGVLCHMGMTLCGSHFPPGKQLAKRLETSSRCRRCAVIVFAVVLIPGSPCTIAPLLFSLPPTALRSGWRTNRRRK
jgi:hypothetical protein